MRAYISRIVHNHRAELCRVSRNPLDGVIFLFSCNFSSWFWRVLALTPSLSVVDGSGGVPMSFGLNSRWATTYRVYRSFGCLALFLPPRQQEKKQFDVNPHMLFVINPDTGEATYSKLSAKVLEFAFRSWVCIYGGTASAFGGGAGKWQGVFVFFFPNE